jgi:hypothetical protein
MRRLAALACASVLLLPACGDTGTPGGGTDRGIDGVDELDPTETPQGVDAGSDEEPYQCVQLSTAPDDEYIVGDAGTAVVSRGEDGLSVGEVTTNDGWEHEVVEESDVRVEIRFVTSNEGEEDLAFVVTDGAELREQEDDVVAEICVRVS